MIIFFQILGETCDLLEDAIDRYTRLIYESYFARDAVDGDNKVDSEFKDPNFNGYLKSVGVLLNTACTNKDNPTFKMNEQCKCCKKPLNLLHYLTLSLHHLN